MDIDLAQKAVAQALAGNWKEAVKLNHEILKKDPKDVDALNRMARAYAELGNTKRAKGLVEKVLKIDPFNTIASKALKKWKG
ncbi:MAG: tetratricopeptide repeat protein, partial [Patescibacteria group bacterium]